MSLYNNVADKIIGAAGGAGSFDGILGGGNLIGGLQSQLSGQINSVVGGLAASVSGALGGGPIGTRLVSAGAGFISKKANGVAGNLVGKYLPRNVQGIINQGAAIAGTANGLINEFKGLKNKAFGAVDEFIERGQVPELEDLGESIPDIFGKGFGVSDSFSGTSIPLLGGITPAEARRRLADFHSRNLARKNLFLVEVSSELTGAGISDTFNMFTTEIDYTPYAIAGDKAKIGGAVVDTVRGSEHVELRITTMDDAGGSIKRWFAAHQGAVAARDGTVGLPVDYAIKIEILHAFIDQNASGYQDKGWYRPERLEVSLSRRENAMSEVQMTFSQLDTFVRA